MFSGNDKSTVVDMHMIRIGDKGIKKKKQVLSSMFTLEKVTVCAKAELTERYL